MEFKFLKFCIGLCILLTFVLFVAIEYSFPIDIVSYISVWLTQLEFNAKLWLQAVSLIFLWFVSLFGLLLFAKHL
jgi:hypothetical protein